MTVPFIAFYAGSDRPPKFSNVCRISTGDATRDCQGGMVREIPNSEGDLETRAQASQLLFHHDGLRYEQDFNKLTLTSINQFTEQQPRIKPDNSIIVYCNKINLKFVHLFEECTITILHTP